MTVHYLHNKSYQLKSFRNILELASPKVMIGNLEKEFDKLGPDIKSYIESNWPELAERVLMDFAVNTFMEIMYRSPIEQKMYFAIKRKYANDFFNYPKSTTLLVGYKVSDISKFLTEQRHKPIYRDGEVDFEIDLFLYLDCFSFDNKNGLRLSCPFYVGIECDGHDYHERTKEQALKDKKKDRTLKAQGFDIVRFTGTEITKDPDKCVEDIDRLLTGHFKKIRAILDNL